ncbi:unnamed protein product, partial [Menidia menidia]
IVERIDTDKDGFVSHAELHHWIKHRQRSYIQENVDKHWKDYDKNRDQQIAWEEYKNTTYGYYLGEEFEDVEDKDTYRSMLRRDQRRFRAADRDGDGLATRQEFTAFLHPEEFDHMTDVVVQEGGELLARGQPVSVPVSRPEAPLVPPQHGPVGVLVLHVLELLACRQSAETVEDIDKDGDGKINVDEYIGDMFTPEEGESEPDWVQTERKHFLEFRDTNKSWLRREAPPTSAGSAPTHGWLLWFVQDGTLDAGEVAHWILPGEVDHADNEAKHLIHETDSDKDGKITKKEILANWNMFVGSQATNYGEDLTRRHEEL